MMTKMEYRRKYAIEVLGWNKNNSSPDYYIMDCLANDPQKSKFQRWLKIQKLKEK
jgi:hypothetical protein